MSYTPFFIGQVVTNQEISEAYKVGNMGGMRRSKAHNCLILISDNTKPYYEDKWYGDVLHYTGMGKIGNQELSFQNKTLYESSNNGVELHLFEVLHAKEYTYRGIVELFGDPYQTLQPDSDGNVRKVWVFPLKPQKGVPILSSEVFHEIEEQKEQKVSHLGMHELRKAAELGSSSMPGTREVISTEYSRNHSVSEFAKRLAKGKCALCNNLAPFNDPSGKPYLETHHIIWLSEGGPDSIRNTVALCPNCHRKVHILKDPHDIDTMTAIAEQNALSV